MEDFKKDPKTGACIRTGPSPIKLLNLRIKENRQKIQEDREKIQKLEEEIKSLRACLNEMKVMMLEPQVLARLLNENITEVKADG